tara:strand:+ start:181 stop:369 length:189 start_codon:yes stop_codon:yes gene_type:complete
MDKNISKHVHDLLKPKKERKVKIESLFYMENYHIMPDGTKMAGKKHKPKKKVKFNLKKNKKY